MKKTMLISFMFLLVSQESFALSMFYSRTNASGSINCQNPQSEFSCMACNCYNEAANEPYQGQVAVGKVVMTRARMKQYPDTVCGVVKHRYPRTRYYQFSWLNAGNPRRSVPARHSCMQAAAESLQFKGYFADHYYAQYVSPKWRKSMRRGTQIGLHIFMASANMPRSTPRSNDYDGRAVASLDIIDQLIFNL